MKKMRKLIPALAMLLVSAVMMSTASFAWFSMSTQATATGMKVQAKADAGILISNGSSAWASSAPADVTEVTKLLPVSTKDATNWYVSTSSAANDAMENEPYADYETKSAANALADGHYLYNDFYIKSSSNEVLTKDIQVKNISITADEGNGALALNKALRVLVKCNNTVYIYATTDVSYEVFKTAHTTETKEEGGETVVVPVPNKFDPVTATAAGDKTDKFGLPSIPNIDAVYPDGDDDTTDAIKVEVYVYFEGEDRNCMSANLAAAVATLTVDITFTAVAVSSGT